MSLLDLPIDILLIITSFVQPRDLLALCATTKILRTPELLYSFQYWHTQTLQDFRLPNRPTAVSHGDGQLWQRLYRRLLTQSRVYVWGSNHHGAVGEDTVYRRPVMRSGRYPRDRVLHHRHQWIPTGSYQTPHEVPSAKLSAAAGNYEHKLGITADLQCGGWSTVLLNTNGEIFIFGELEPCGQHTRDKNPLLLLKFPSAYASSATMRWRAIKQMSLGRSHLLGLSDTGTLWFWCDEKQHALRINLPDFDREERENMLHGTSSPVTKAVAGWHTSSAFVKGKGIILWKPISGSYAHSQRLFDNETDGISVEESWTIPGTSSLPYSPPLWGADTQFFLGNVVNWIVLENFVIFTTDSGRAFCVKIPDNNTIIGQPVELRVQQSQKNAQPSTESLNRCSFEEGSRPAQDESKTSESLEDQYDFVIDVQGAFRHFALFYRSGVILTGYQDALTDLFVLSESPSTDLSTIPRLERIPALQNSSVVSLAFGDWHLHALHASGHVTSYTRGYGHGAALGLLYAHYQGADCDVQLLRGITSRNLTATLQWQCWTSGRRIIFQEEAQEWLSWLKYSGENVDGVMERIEECMNDAELRAGVSEWIEQRLRKWEHVEPRNDSGEGSNADTKTDENDDDDSLPAHFVLSVAGGGWHSGALVLVNERKAKRVQDSYLVGDDSTDMTHAESDDASEKEKQDKPGHNQGHYIGLATRPSQMVAESTLSALFFLYITTFFRWFLGLPSAAPTHATSSQNSAHGHNTFFSGPADGVGAHTAASHWRWQQPETLETFPRLRKPDGSAMSGNEPVLDWPWPVWQEVQVVPLRTRTESD